MNSIEMLAEQFRASDECVIEIADEILGTVTIGIDPCPPEKGQARLVIDAHEAPVASCILSAISGVPSWWGYVGTTLYPELQEEELRSRYKNAGSHMPPAWPISSLIASEIERLRLAYAVAVCFEAHRPNRSALEPMPIGGYAGTDSIRAEWERIGDKVSIGPGCLFAPAD